MDIYLAALRLSKYPSLFTSTLWIIINYLAYILMIIRFCLLLSFWIDQQDLSDMHSRQCFIGYPNTLNFIKNTLFLIFSTLFLVLRYPKETLSHTWYTISLSNHDLLSPMQWRHDIVYIVQQTICLWQHRFTWPLHSSSSSSSSRLNDNAEEGFNLAFFCFLFADSLQMIRN